MRCARQWLPGVLAALLATPAALALDRAELDLRFKQAMAAGASLSDKADDSAEAGAREALLRGLLEDAPDYEPARAELGQVEVDGRWLPVDYAQHLASEDPRLAEYETLRQAADDSLADHTRLAKWCEKRGLTHEARPHWVAVIASRPQHPAALDGLNAAWIDGSLWDVELAKEAQDRAESIAKAAKEWERRFRKFEKRRYVRDEDLAAIRAELDVAAIEPIERRVAVLLGKTTEQAAERAEMLVEAWFDAVERLDEVEVTTSLCQIATLGSESHRRDAIDALRKRSQFDSMPTLLSALIAPIDSEYRVSRDRFGNVTYEHRLQRQDEDAQQVHDRMRTADVQVRTVSLTGPNLGSYTTEASLYEAFLAARFDGLKNQLRYQGEANRTNQLIAAHNAMANQVNERVIAVLTELSGRDLGSEPHAWWDHWRQKTGYEVFERPTERTYDVTYKIENVIADPTTYYIPPPPPPPRCECFVAGTPVWTRTGKVAIEELKAGDLVMARDPHRGGLTYRAVLDTTVRRPSPMVSITLKGQQEEIIRATVGHPFWVVGDGWCMAENLKAGDLVSTVNGPLPVAQINEAPDRRAYNLIVEGAANYYVGENGVLVHDNTPRKPAVGLVARR